MASSKKESKTYYVVTFRDPEDEKVQEIKARSISDSTLGLSFIEISDFMFATNSVVVAPSEEYMQKHFEDVKSLHLSIYNVISIKEVGENHQGLHFDKDKSNLVVLNNPSSTPTSH